MKKINIFIAGHNGMVGKSIYKKLLKNKIGRLITAERKKLDLEDLDKVHKFIKRNRPDVIINCAGKVGGILANNTYPTEFLNENIQIQVNLIKSAYLNNVEHFINLGSSCIYPKKSKQPIKESYLLTGSLEKTNEAYALAKIIGLKMCEFYNSQYNKSYLTLMPCNLYGPHDNFDSKNSHFLPALIKKIITVNKHKNKAIEIWGTGKPKREVMHVDDLASAISFILKKKINNDFKLLKLIKKSSVINVGSGYEHTIENFAKIICKLGNNKNKLFFNKNYPDGTMRKILDSSLIRSLGWKPKIQIKKGLSDTINWYKTKKSQSSIVSFSK
jgi:GDP-L-fucose synthase|tara:strand:- start:652 stop:1638 length:987 start_codon:yes stop_codon:yes gene_type:complete